MKSNRIKKSLCDGWEFRLANSIEWQSVAIPHTWNAVDGCNGEANYRGVGFYRRSLLISEEELSRQIFIEFEGANTVTELFINGVSAGRHEGGYSAFRFDITSLVKAGENELTVTVDNSPTDFIAPIMDEGDFTKMGGIYRKVHLILTDKLHIDMLDFGSSGVYLTQQKVSVDCAVLSVSVKLRNDSEHICTSSVRCELLDSKNNIVAECHNNQVSTNAYSDNLVCLDMQFDNVHLWQGMEDPYLYTCRVTSDGNGYKDEVSFNTGLRTVELDNGRGVLLNGKRVYLKGVNYHQDTDSCGWAMSDTQREADYEEIAKLGANAVRMAHYQHCAHEYDICDRSGLAVWSEIPLINRTTVGEEKALNPRLYDNLRQQLIEMIRQNYNHPSVFFWGISNELYDVDEGTKDIYSKLVALAKLEDPSRPVIYADNTASDGTRDRSASADAVGYNRYDGWYYSHLGGMSQWTNEKYALDSRPTCVSEYGGAGALTQHMDNPTQADIDPNGLRHWEEYQAIVHEETWRDLSRMGNIFGSFIWCMFDFASALRVEGDTKGQNDKGLMTRDRRPKDAYYFYKSLWTSEPMVHITSKGFVSRPYVIPTIKVYSNCPSVELLVNGVSYGVIEQTDGTVFKWDNIKLNKGEANTVTAIAYAENGTRLSDCAQWFGA